MLFTQLLLRYPDMFSEVDMTTMFIFFLVFMLMFIGLRKPAGIPPGPLFTIPVLGDLPQIAAAKGDVVGMLRKLRKKHGKIYSFYMGRQLAIIVNGYSMIHKVAVERGVQFCGRPQTYMTVNSKGKGLSLASGNTWKQQRHFVSKAFLKLGMRKRSYENHIIKEMKELTECIEKQRGQPVDIKPYIHTSAAKVVISSVIGQHNSMDTLIPSFLQLVEDEAKLLPKVSILLDCLPFLKYIPGDPLQMLTMQKKFQHFIEFAKERLIEPVKNSPNEATTFVELYLEKVKEQEDVDDDTVFTLDQMNVVVHDILAGAATTVPAMIRWAILYLINFPDIQKRLQQHIDEVMPITRMPRLDDRIKLPYVEAFMAEVLRCVNFTPLGGPRAEIDGNGSYIEGYLIPKDATIMFDYDSIFMDDEIFERPDIFNPDRFLNKIGAFVTPKEFIPFSVGRRTCVGMQLAKWELFLYMANLIKTFTFLPADDEHLPKISGSLGATYEPDKYTVRCERRI